MSREIKFRAWDKEKSVMYFEHFVSITVDGKIFFIDETGEWIINPKRIVLMQYAGLHDKNGKEIYEGDILQESYDGGIVLWTVEWCENECLFMIKNHTQSEIFIGEDMVNVFKFSEAIGNIYENSELLKK